MPDAIYLVLFEKDTNNLCRFDLPLSSLSQNIEVPIAKQYPLVELNKKFKSAILELQLKIGQKQKISKNETPSKSIDFENSNKNENLGYNFKVKIEYDPKAFKLPEPVKILAHDSKDYNEP